MQFKYLFVGVEMLYKGLKQPVMVDVTAISELKNIEVCDTGVNIGAAVTLTELQNFLRKLLEKEPSKGIFI